MVCQTGLRIQQFISLFRKKLVSSLLKNMENNVLEHSTSLFNKSDKASQCSLLCYNEQEVSHCGDDGTTKIEEEICDQNADALGSKRKINDSAESTKKSKKLKQDLNLIRPGFTDERFSETSYYFENGLRKVYPYYFTFTSYTKGRWVGKTLIEVFGKEFRAHSSEEYERHIKKGSLTINNECVTPDYILKHNDLLANIVHRHEVPVTSDTIDIIHVDEDIVVINKPPSIPVHPCGRYRHNTIIFILAKEYNLKDLKTIHRLDRLTSGVLIFGRTLKTARKLEAEIRERAVKKQYVCRVEGKFPETIECREPIEVISNKMGVCKVSPKGKQCHTSFQLLGYNEKVNTSVVICKPHSGRMHQIRVHLQYLGYPIENDPLYNDTIFGPEKGRNGNFGGKSDEQLVKDLIFAHNAENWCTSFNELPCLPEVLTNSSGAVSAEKSQITEIIDHNSESFISLSTQTGMDMPDMKFDKSKISIDPFCQECKIHYKDPESKDLIMYLHAMKYSGSDWAYESPMPVWADVNWKKP